MRKFLFVLGAAALAVGAAKSAVASPAYSFEGSPPPDGFGPNGGGVTVSQDVIGVTDGSNSMKVSVVTGATFVGALTGFLPAPIGDPPGIEAILFDMTIGSGEEFTGGFAVIGVTIFGASQPGMGQQFGLQAQFADFEHIGGKAAGTYKDVRIDLSSATNPLTFVTNESFNQIFGPNPGAPNDVIPTGFQLFINKSNDAPVTVYIDNIRTIVPEPATAALACLAAAALGFGRRRRD